MRKTDIVNLLARKFGCRKVLEISTPTTGGKFAGIDAARLAACDRLVYNCRNDLDDGNVYSFRTPAPSSKDLIETLVADGRKYDLVFVDAYHTESCSAEDLAGAFSLIEPGGWVVVHDCSPTNPDVVAPSFTSGEWCGLTYATFIDFIIGRTDLRFFTVDCDYGCGAIQKTSLDKPQLRRDDPIAKQWLETRPDDGQRFSTFDTYRRRLLNLMSPEAFLQSEYLLLEFAAIVLERERQEDEIWGAQRSAMAALQRETSMLTVQVEAAELRARLHEAQLRTLTAAEAIKQARHAQKSRNAKRGSNEEE
jgi:hypothetical protein